MTKLSGPYYYQRLCFCSGALRSHLSSHETKRGTKIKIYSLHLTAPLQKHFVSNCALLPSWLSVGLYFIVTVSRNRIDCLGTWLSVLCLILLCPWVTPCIVSLRGGQLWRIFRFTLTTLSSIGAVGRHSWQSFGLAGWIVRALPSVLLGRATFSGYT